jgi:hypothetical protein
MNWLIGWLKYSENWGKSLPSWKILRCQREDFSGSIVFSCRTQVHLAFEKSVLNKGFLAMQEIDPSELAESQQPSKPQKISWFMVATAASIVFFVGNADYSLAFSKLQRLGNAVFSSVGRLSEAEPLGRFVGVRESHSLDLLPDCNGRYNPLKSRQFDYPITSRSYPISSPPIQP